MERNTIHNIASNYCHIYMLNESKWLDDLKQLVAKHYPRHYQIYTHICNNAPNTNVEMYVMYIVCGNVYWFFLCNNRCRAKQELIG